MEKGDHICIEKPDISAELFFSWKVATNSQILTEELSALKQEGRKQIFHSEGKSLNVGIWYRQSFEPENTI